MNIGKTFSVILLVAVTLSSVGFTTLGWYCPMESAKEKAVCGSCASEKQQKPDCAEDDCCKQYAEFMHIQPDLTVAVKLQPNLDSPQSEALIQLPEESAILTKNWANSPIFERALPDRVAYEHVVLRI